MYQESFLSILKDFHLNNRSLYIHTHSCTLNLAGGDRLDFDFCNASLPIGQRLSDLVSRMTYEEKCASLDTSNPAVPRLGLPSMSGGESTHGISSGCGKPSGPNSTGWCPTGANCTTMVYVIPVFECPPDDRNPMAT